MTTTARCSLLALLCALGCAHKGSAPSYDAQDYGYGADAMAGPMAKEAAYEAEAPMAAAMTPTVTTTSTPPTSAPMAPGGVMATVPSQAVAATTEPDVGGEPAVEELELPTTGADAVDQMLVFNGSMQLMVEPDGIARGIDAAVDAAVRAGGYIAQQTDVLLTLRIPSGRFRKVMKQIEALGEVRSRSVQTVDVSEEFHDLKVRLDNLQSTRGRMQKLLAQAKDLGEILTVEKELERISAEIDRIEGRLRFLSSQAAFSTLTIAFAELPRELPVLVDDGHHEPPPPPPPLMLDSPVGWVDHVGVHHLVRMD